MSAILSFPSVPSSNPYDLIRLVLFEPETQKALPNEKLWLVSRVCPTCYSQLFINERFLANQLYHFNPEALCSHFRLVRTLNPPTDMSLDGRVTITSTFNHAVVDTKVAYQIYARAVAALFKNAMEVTEFGGFKFFPGLNYLEAMEFSHTPRTDGNKDLSVKLIFAKGMDKEHCSSLDYHIKVLFMSMTLYEEVSLGISPEPEPCKLSYDNQDYPVDSASGLSALLTTLIDLDAYSRRGKPILIENKTAGMTSAFANSAQRYIVAADFRLNRTGAIPLLILKLYEFLSMAIIHKNVEISVVLGQYIPVRHFIQFFMLHPCGCSNYSLNFSLALPDAQLGMTKAVCLRTVFEVLLRGLDASEIKVSVGQMDEAPNLSVSFFNLKAPVDPKKFRYNSVIYTPTPAKVQKNAANTMKQPTRKELLRIAQNESRRIKREVQKNQSQTASKPAAVPPPQAQEPYHTESKDTVQSSDATAPVKLDAGPHSPELNTQPEPKLSLAAGSAQPLTSGSVDESKAKEQTDNTVESPSPVTLSNVEHLPFEMKIAVEKEPEKPTILVKEEPVDMGTCSLNPIGCQHVKPLAESREHILQVKSLQLKSTASRPTHRDRLRIPVSFK